MLMLMMVATAACGEPATPSVGSSNSQSTNNDTDNSATNNNATNNIVRCEVDEHVEGGACVTCPAGTFTAEGDDQAGGDTECEPLRCFRDERVEANDCVACPAGTTSEEGADASGADTACDAAMCPSNEHVEAGACIPCAPGTTNLAGDDPSGEDTRCDPTLCEVDERVENHTCVACPPDATNDAGDSAVGADTVCDDACTIALGVTCGEFEQAYLKAPNPDENDWFGYVVALDGDTLAVSAPNEDSNAVGVGGDQTNNDLPNSGAVFVFTRSGTTWTQEAYLKASNPGVGDQFGWTVDLNGDTLAVGAQGEDSDAVGVNNDQSNDDADGSGAVYVFTRSGTTWSQQAYLKASNTDAYDAFGTVSLDGDTLAVGARLEFSGATGVDNDETDNSAPGAGAVYVFTRSGTTWSQQAYLKASNTGPGDNFGHSVSLDGDTIAVGAYKEASNATMINGDQSDDSAELAGAVYVFTRSGSTWTQQSYIKASNAEEGDLFGLSVALSGDTLAVGAYREDSASSFVNGDQTDNSAENAGAAYVFTRSGTTWSQQAYLKASYPTQAAAFGRNIELVDDTLVVGARQENSDATGLNGDETNSNAPGSGAAHLFTRIGTTWSHRAYIKASNTEQGDGFGGGLTLDSNTLVVSAFQEDSSAAGQGGDQTDNSAESSGAVYIRTIAP